MEELISESFQFSHRITLLPIAKNNKFSSAFFASIFRKWKNLQSVMIFFPFSFFCFFSFFFFFLLGGFQFSLFPFSHSHTVIKTHTHTIFPITDNNTPTFNRHFHFPIFRILNLKLSHQFPCDFTLTLKLKLSLESSPKSSFFDCTT